MFLNPVHSWLLGFSLVLCIYLHSARGPWTRPLEGILPPQKWGRVSSSIPCVSIWIITATHTVMTRALNCSFGLICTMSVTFAFGFFLFPKCWRLDFALSAFLAVFLVCVSCLILHLLSLPLGRRRNENAREKASQNRVRNLDKSYLQTPHLATVRERGLQPSDQGGVCINRIHPAFSCQANCHLTKLFITSPVGSKPYPDSILCHCEIPV